MKSMSKVFEDVIRSEAVAQMFCFVLKFFLWDSALASGKKKMWSSTGKYCVQSAAESKKTGNI